MSELMLKSYLFEFAAIFVKSLLIYLQLHKSVLLEYITAGRTESLIDKSIYAPAISVSQLASRCSVPQ